MKKLFTILLVAASCSTAFSQEKGNFEYGFNVGLNLSTVTSGTNNNSDSRVGFNAGAFGDYFFSDRWSIKAKLTYDQKGWNSGYFINEDDSFLTDYHFDYLTVPVMANWHFGKKRNWYLNFGPYVGFLMSAKESRFGIDIKELTQSIDAGLALGIGVKIPVSDKIKIVLESDGQSGLTDTFKNNTGNSIRNSRSSLNAGLVFGL
ncbi:porin family protein [Pedobacter sp. MR2016-24]|uniref:porin family protein n=1 Tax=Pedobacter sp. MR2016-24 TaxID=2994466 RepID=UPI002247A17D|nr:porin family protein [Pedobacter sp. MR2016-24]MCX2483724.1 porin family protein [Pedobacter sp. MR2016-24]